MSYHSNKPSSSCRSAEFLGNQKALFPTQIQKALGPFKIGLSDDDTSIEYLANSNLCVLIRKLNKKDPITKKKALEELIDDINHAHVEELIKILPLWSKIYKNLASDPTHNVRDLTQVVHKMLALKCKRNMAPYLKLLVPVWLFSHFDNYTPAASTARSSFYDIFDVKLNRIQEVCLHCQLQILEHIHEHLSKSLVVSTSKDVDDNHFNGNIYSSLEVFSFFTEHTKTANLLQQSHVILRSILELKIFWSFGTQGSKPVRTAWFKVINNLVSNESISGIILDYKWKIIEISFNGIDEKEEMLSSAIWKLILQLQLKYSDWYNHLDYEVIQLKLLCLFQNNLFYNFQVVCPKMLSFYSALMTAYFSERDWHTLYGNYLTDLKLMFCSESLNAKEKDYEAIFDAYFDCWKYILSKFHSANHTDTTCSLELLHTTIIDPIEWLLYANKPEASKTYFDAISRMILEWKNENMRIGHKEWFYNNLLKKFWESIFDVFTKHIDDTEHFPDEIIQLIQCLVQLNHDSVNGNSGFKLPGDVIDTANEDSLKRIALQFSRCCLNKLTDHESQNCVKHIHSFINIFGEPGFFKDITNSSDLKDSIQFFVDLTSSANKDFYLDLTEIIFKLLHFVASDEKCEFIKNSLFSVQPLDMQILILEHLLFTSLITSEQRELLLSGPEARTFIRYITKQSLMKGSITTNAWFERLFVQSENGDFIVGSATVDALLQDLCEHLQKETSAELNELCVNILSQVLPIVFTQKNVLQETKAKMFSNIFQVLVQSITNNFLTDSTFLKLTTCWENVLSNENIVAEETTISCTNFLKHMVTYKTLTIPIIRKSADLITRFIIGAAKNSCTTKVSSMKLNKLIPSCLSSSDISPLLEHLYEYCLVLEAISGLVSPRKQLNYQCLEQHDFKTILQRSVLNLYIIKQLNDSKEFDALKGSFSDKELNLFNNNMCIELLNCMAVLSAGENVLKTKTGENISIQVWFEELQQQIMSMICKDSPIINVVEGSLIQNAMVPHITYCRSLPILAYLSRYQKYEENASIIFTEEMLSYFLDKGALTTAVYFMQYELPRLNHRTITVQKMFICAQSSSGLIKSASLRCLVIHFFKCYEIATSDRVIVTQLLKLVRGISEEFHRGNRMLYHVCINECEFDKVVELLEYIRLLTSMLTNMTWDISFKEWDDITEGICRWVSTMLQSINMFTNLTVALFIINVCRIFSSFMEFVKAERKISSTSLIRKKLDEWESLFAKQTHWEIFQTIVALLQNQEKADVEYFSLLFNEVMKAIIHLDFDSVYSLCKTSPCITPESVFILLIKNLSNSSITVQRACFFMLHELTHLYVVDDIKKINEINSTSQLKEETNHHIQLFEDFLMAYDPLVERYLSQFRYAIRHIPYTK